MSATIRTWADVGVVVRGAFKRELRGYCHLHGLTCEISEDKGILSSRFYITVAGDEGKVRVLAAWIREAQSE